MTLAPSNQYVVCVQMVANSSRCTAKVNVSSRPMMPTATKLSRSRADASCPAVRLAWLGGLA
ncbi:hypothetical protein KOI35_00050 [Actinoplanes bogorensis]|uniref:Uncharacterized protein n=1 Tax=Paractinoplanes bogorensis TaxID=1610840 RepID=A0ABS5YEV6_9ACTN|nr:hypothetical protein [Actinoplanes bogorensis]MBU2661887.1 hypothetical protein [Actinoplanes bogorensis]